MKHNKMLQRLTWILSLYRQQHKWRFPHLFNSVQFLITWPTYTSSARTVAKLYMDVECPWVAHPKSTLRKWAIRRYLNRHSFFVLSFYNLLRAWILSADPIVLDETLWNVLCRFKSTMFGYIIVTSYDTLGIVCSHYPWTRQCDRLYIRTGSLLNRKYVLFSTGVCYIYHSSAQTPDTFCCIPSYRFVAVRILCSRLILGLIIHLRR